MRKLAHWVNTLLLGPHCEMGCGAHVYPRDTQWHREHYCSMTRDRQS
jgi:hypothetical protein